MLEVKHISKRFGEHQVLADVSLKVNQGDVVVILGPSGSGKTTFLRCLNHLEKADSGQLTLSGKDYDLAKLSKKEILEIRRKTAFVFQHYNLFANKTALENILEGLVIARKIPREEALKIAEESLKRVGLLAYKDYYPSQLSQAVSTVWVQVILSGLGRTKLPLKFAKPSVIRLRAWSKAAASPGRLSKMVADDE